MGNISDSLVPLGVTRSTCYFGKSNWNDYNAHAHFDQIKIFNRGLTSDEVLNDMIFG